MLFNSLEFLLFFPTVLGLYWLLNGHRSAQNLLILVSSFFFYGWWDVRFLYLIAFTTVFDFNAAQLIENRVLSLTSRLKSVGFIVIAYAAFVLPESWQQGVLTEGGYSGLIATALLSVLVMAGPALVGLIPERLQRKSVVVLSVVVNLTILGFFKYFNFFIDSFQEMYLTVFGVEPSIIMLSIVLPVGISFYTFQSMSYTIDVYRRDMKSTPSIVEFGAYLSFFPQLVAGPIERGKNLLPQFQRDRIWDADQAREGIWLIAWGLFKKVVIADNLSILVNSVFSAYDQGDTSALPEGGGLLVLIAVYAFAFQIYADFSAYSDIARGTAKLMGFDLMLNFRLPYIATNPSDFWQRWHISLSSWLRDYLYIPLGGNRNGKFATYRNLWLTMLLGGLWHGANWTFVLWGFYQGMILVLYRLLGIESAGAKSTGVMKAIHVLWFFQLTCLGWLIFRAQNLDTIWIFLASIFSDFRGSVEASEAGWTLLSFVWPLLLVQALQIRFQSFYVLPRFHWFANLNIWLLILLSIGVFASNQFKPAEFIYFAF